MIVSFLLFTLTACSLLSQVASPSRNITRTISELSLTVWCRLSADDVAEGIILPHEANPVSSSASQATGSAAITQMEPIPLAAADQAHFTDLCK